MRSLYNQLTIRRGFDEKIFLRGQCYMITVN